MCVPGPPQMGLGAERRPSANDEIAAMRSELYKVKLQEQKHAKQMKYINMVCLMIDYSSSWLYTLSFSFIIHGYGDLDN